jgi:tetratricopeptide (TPR) repeat protein
LDPKLADAAANIAWLHEFKIESGTGGGEARIQMEQWGRRALEIDPKNSRAWGIQVIAELLGEKPDMSRLVAAGLRSAAFGPRNSLANNVLGMALSNHSVLLTLEAMQRAQELDPLYLYPPLNIADIYAHVGRTDEALRQVNEVLQIEPDMPAALAEKQLTFIQMGRVHDAEELAPRLEKYVAEGRLDPASISRLRDGLTLLQGDDRKKKAALEHLAKLWALEADRTAFYEYYAELSWLVRYGGTALAIDATTRRLAHGGTLPYDFLETAADLEPLRQDPRASRIAAQSKAQFEALVSVLQEARARGELPAYMERPLSELLARLNLPAGT